MPSTVYDIRLIDAEDVISKGAEIDVTNGIVALAVICFMGIAVHFNNQLSA
jgi:hypothetical protein